MYKIRIVTELLDFFWKRKLWWLIPLIITLLVVGSLALFVQTSALAPILYPLF